VLRDEILSNNELIIIMMMMVINNEKNLVSRIFPQFFYVLIFLFKSLYNRA
jgi:hypothetical protein